VLIARGRRARRPDEKGIETKDSRKVRGVMACGVARDAPMRRGLRRTAFCFSTLAMSTVARDAPMRRGLRHLPFLPGCPKENVLSRARRPDEKGIETRNRVWRRLNCAFLVARDAPMRRGLRQGNEPE